MSNQRGDAVLSEPTFHTPDKIWLELHREKDACDVIVKMDDGTVYTSMFVTFAYLQRQMDLQLKLTQQLHDTPPARYYVLDTPHVLVEELSRDAIEDTIDNMIALDTFESHMTRVTDTPTPDGKRTTSDGRRATQEVAAVVISDVLVVQD